MIKRAYLDVETTGTIPYLHGMYELAGVIDIDGEVEEEFCFLMFPFHDDEWDPRAEKINGMNMEKLRATEGVMSPENAFRAFKKILLKYIDENDYSDRFVFCGHSCTFDQDFIRAWMVRNNYFHMNKLFYTGFLDTRVLATLHAVNNNCMPKNFKLMTLLNHFGIPFVEKELHGALYDIQKTRELFMEVEKML